MNYYRQFISIFGFDSPPDSDLSRSRGEIRAFRVSIGDMLPLRESWGTRLGWARSLPASWLWALFSFRAGSSEAWRSYFTEGVHFPSFED
jgi:hypothetical protein